MIGSRLSYEMWNIRSVNRLYVDNLGPPGIGETVKILVEISIDFYMSSNKKKYPYFFLLNCRKVTINAYESVGRYTTCIEIWF